MPDTALSVAFTRAGIKSADECLTEIAIKAMVEHADNTFATCDAIWEAVQKDRGLMVELFKYSWRRDISALLYRTQTLIAHKDNERSLKRPIELKAAKVVQLIRREEEREEAEQRASKAAYQAEQDREYQEYLAKWQATRIGSLTISEKPVWQCTPGTVRAWLVTQQRRWRTVELLIEGLPDDGRPIEYYRKPEEVAALWAAAAV